MKIILIGFMCSGKSRVGEIISEKLNIPHYDTDLLIENKAGSSVADIINNHGVSFFRDMERDTVKDLLLKEDCVISTGGGLPLDARNLEAFDSNTLIVWLRVSPHVVLSRAGDLKTRPLIDPKNPSDSIMKLQKERRQFYEMAPYQIDTDHMTPDQVADKILTWHIKNPQ